jgi:3-oxoacyl-[acyl-carrier-protein] synthase II
MVMHAPSGIVATASSGVQTLDPDTSRNAMPDGRRSLVGRSTRSTIGPSPDPAGTFDPTADRVGQGLGGTVHDVAITGLGIISSLGFDVTEHSRRLLDGELGIKLRTLPLADGEQAVLSAGIEGFRGRDWIDERLLDGTDGFARFAMAAATQAVDDAGVGELDPLRTAIVHGTSMGGTRALLEAQHLLETKGPDSVPRKTMIKIWPNMAAAQIAMKYDLHGQQITVCTACASSIDAIGTAARLIADGRADAAIAGGTEGGSVDDGTEFVAATYYSGNSYGMSSQEPDPRRAALPFDVARRGIVSGEGSAMLFLERADHARARGARIYGIVRGYGTVADAFHPSSPEPSGRWEQRAMELALEEAELDPSAIDAVVAHATGTPKGDTAEIRAINNLYGGRGLPVTSLKGTIGHTGAAAGAMGLMAGITAMHEGRLAPTMGTTDPEPEIDFAVVLHRAADVRVEALQVNAFGFGGQDASLVVTKS